MPKRIAPAPAARLVSYFVIACVSTAPAADSPRVPTAADLAAFAKRIRPVRVGKCYSGHTATAEKLTGGLRLDSRTGSRAGGDNGHAIVPGDRK